MMSKGRTIVNTPFVTWRGQRGPHDKGIWNPLCILAITRLQTASKNSSSSYYYDGEPFSGPNKETRKAKVFWCTHHIPANVPDTRLFAFWTKGIMTTFFPCFYEHENVRLTRKIGRVDTLFWIVIFRELRWLAVFPAYRNYICTVLT